MSYNPSIPNAAQSPGLFPAQNSTNFNRLKKIIEADHVFNDSSQTSDGIHKQVNLISKALNFLPVLPGGSNTMLYSKVDSSGANQLFYYNGASIVQVTPGIVAMVNFNGSLAVGPQTIRSQINVSSVNKTATGRYTINFTTAMSDTNYIIQVCGHSTSGTNGISNGAVDGSVAYSTAVQTGSVRIQFNGSGSSLNDVTGGFVVITRVF